MGNLPASHELVLPRFTFLGVIPGSAIGLQFL